MDFNAWTHNCWPTFIRIVWTLDSDEKTCEEQSLLGTEGEKKSREFVLSSRLYNDNNDDNESCQKIICF